MVHIEEDAEVDNLKLEQQRMGKVDAEVAFRPEAYAENAEPRSSHPYATEAAGKAESARKGKAKRTGGGIEDEGEGWETASEGDDNTSSNLEIHEVKAATTSVHKEEDYGDPLTEEEQQARALAQANATKVEGNRLYAAGEYEEALRCYAGAADCVANDPSANELRAQCHSNRAICRIQQRKYTLAVDESTKALELSPNYVKALMRRAQAQEKLDKYDEAVTDLKKVIELEPANKPARDTVRRLEPIAAERREKLKEEMLGKLKELGNSFLGRVGMSMDNFKTVQDPATGSYSVSLNK